LGKTLVHRALKHAFLSDIADKLANYYRLLGIDRASPRLETVLQVVDAVHGEAVLGDLLTDLEAPSNSLHAFFADHLALGGRHVTMNFDTCIERAGTGQWPDNALLHVHGRLGHEELGATLARIERGLPGEIRTRLGDLLLSPQVSSIVFVGYSGSDFFDVDPFLASLPQDSLSGRQVLWIEHCRHVEQVEPRRRQLRALHDAGAQVREVHVLTAAALREIGKQWRASFNEKWGDPRPWRPRVPVEAELKRRATIELFALMGLHREIDALLEPHDAHDWEIQAQTRWAQGRYAEAGSAWEIARATASPAARSDRVGAVAWIRGEYRRARDVLVEALMEGDGSLEERLTLAETLARAYVHMRRSPDSFCLATPQLRAFVLDHLPDPVVLAKEGKPLGTHLRNRVISARASLGGGPADDGGAVESFGEYEALNAQLNYRQARLRADASRAPVEAEKFHALRRDFETIGAVGDAARAALLAGPFIFQLRELRQATLQLQVTRRQRYRLLGSSLGYGLLRQMRMVFWLLRPFRSKGQATESSSE
jgi:hypothetical protein